MMKKRSPKVKPLARPEVEGLFPGEKKILIFDRLRKPSPYRQQLLDELSELCTVPLEDENEKVLKPSEERYEVVQVDRVVPRTMWHERRKKIGDATPCVAVVEKVNGKVEWVDHLLYPKDPKALLELLKKHSFTPFMAV